MNAQTAVQPSWPRRLMARWFAIDSRRQAAVDREEWLRALSRADAAVRSAEIDVAPPRPAARHSGPPDLYFGAAAHELIAAGKPHLRRSPIHGWCCASRAHPELILTGATPAAAYRRWLDASRKARAHAGHPQTEERAAQ